MDQLLDKVGKIEKNELVKKAIERGLDGELVLVGLQKLVQTGGCSCQGPTGYQ
jgi:hypothetical protein